MADKKIFVPKIYSPDDLSKKWFVYWLDQSGKRVRKYADINKHNTYESRMLAAQAFIDSLSFNPTLSIAEKLQEYVDESKPRWRKKTWQTHQSKLNVFIEWLSGRPVDRETIKGFFAHLINNRHRTTHNDYVSILKKMLTAIGEDSIMEGIQKVKSHPTPAKYFQKYQVKRLKAAIVERDPQLWLFCQFIYYCFIRPGTELRLLKVGDIHLDDESIRVRGDISKNRKTEYVSIPDPFLPSLKFITRLDPVEYVFPAKGDVTKPMGMNTMRRRHRLILRELGFTHEYKLYSWKHTGAVNYIKNGGNVKQLQIQLRHHSLDQVDQYLRQLGVHDIGHLKNNFPEI